MKGPLQLPRGGEKVTLSQNLKLKVWNVICLQTNKML